MQGSFVWYELMTTDMAAAAKFYGDVAGWQCKDSGMQGMSYSLFNIPGYDMGTAGLMELTAEMRARQIPPNWTGYVAVDDVDAKAGAFAEEGGTVHMAPHDIPGIGRFAVVGDPQGAVICLFKPNMPDGPLPPEPDASTPGTFGWSELMAENGEEAFAFYAKMFGWQKDTAVDMGPLGIYQLFGLGGPAIGGMMTKPADVPMPFWGYYINVEAIDAAVERVKAGGGQVINGPMEVPGSAWIVQCLDPQGAYFALVSMER